MKTICWTIDDAGILCAYDGEDTETTDRPIFSAMDTEAQHPFWLACGYDVAELANDYPFFLCGDSGVESLTEEEYLQIKEAI